jgi:hypothetical protein
MRAPSSDIGVPTAEPKGGDFVAYLAQIEKRQLAALPARAAHTPPALTGPHTPHAEDKEAMTGHAPLSATEAERLRESLTSGAGQRKGLVGAAFMALVGLFLTVLGLFGDGGIVALLIGIFLLWRALSTVRRAVAALSLTQSELAARLVGTLRQVRNK